MSVNKLSEFYGNQKKSTGKLHKLLQERIDNANPRRALTAEESKRLSKLEAIVSKLKLGENVQNRHLQTWLRENEYEQVDIEWQAQLGRRLTLKSK